MNTHRQSEQPIGPADLDWLAWQYVADELDADARAAFEARLLDDVSACEAVARAVELSDVVAAALSPASAFSETASAMAPPVIVPSSSVDVATGWTQRIGWMSLGAAACLAIVLGARAWESSRLAQTGLNQDDALAAEEDPSRTLAQAWTELSAMDDALLPADTPVAESTATDAESSAIDARPSSDDTAPPDWLLAAVADQSDTSTETVIPLSPPPPTSTPN